MSNSVNGYINIFKIWFKLKLFLMFIYFVINFVIKLIKWSNRSVNVIKLIINVMMININLFVVNIEFLRNEKNGWCLILLFLRL